MCHEFLTHPLLVFSLFGFGFQPFSALAFSLLSAALI